MAASVLLESRHRRRWSVPVMPLAAFILVACASCFLTTRTRGESSLVGHGERPSFHTKFPRRPRSEARVVEANVENQTLTIGVLTGEELGQGPSFRSAIRLAFEDVQADSSLTFPYPLRLSFGNTGSTRFQAQAAALQTMLDDALLVLGPEYSSQAHSIIDLCRDYQVPMLSFSATDPTLSSKGQFPYFVRLSHSDQMEMEVIADILQYYQWHQAIMIYSDDEFGHNGIDALTNILMAKSQQLPLQFSNKVALDPRATNEEITQLLRAMQSSETSVFVVHVASSNVLFLLDEAQRMGLMSEGYVWISTEGAISLLMGANMNSTYLSSLTGMVGTRVAIRDNPRLLEFKRRWKNLDTVKYPGSGTDTVSPYSLLAYDAFWVAARALHNLSHLPGASFPFRPRRPVLPPDGGGSTDFARLKVSKAGVRILEELVKTKMDGIIGKVAFDENHDRVGVSYEVVNLVASNFETLGYWEQGKGLVAAPSKEPSNTTLKPAVWPGNTSKFPRGWLPSKGKALRIAVPFGPSAVEQYVSRTPDGNFSGLCVEVFQRAMALLPYPVGYSLVAYDFRGSFYEDLIHRVANKEYDGAVGDITVTADRAQIVDFTQPFMESGLGLVVPVLQGDPANPWAFLYPFTGSMWALMIASIVFTAAVIWYLEHNQNLDFGGGPYHHQLTTSLWFSFASMVRSQEQHVGTVLGRFVVISWLFVVLIVTCSYTANLTSILTVNNLTPPVQSLAAVITSGSVVGYLNGSFSEKHLLGFGVRRKQLQPLNSVDEYAEAMLNGTVVGVVDERPFLDLILTQDCTFTTGDADISTLGWAFAFQKGSNLAVDLSKAIAQLSETGQLRSIHSNYVPNNLTCSGDASGQSSDSLGVEGFQNLFILYAAMATFACLMYLGVLLYRGHLAKKELEEEGEEVSGGMSAIKAKPWMNPFKHFIYLYNLGVAWSIARNIECDEDEPFYDADTFDVYEGTSFNQSEFTNGTDEGSKHDPGR